MKDNSKFPIIYRLLVAIRQKCNTKMTNKGFTLHMITNKMYGTQFLQTVVAMAKVLPLLNH